MSEAARPGDHVAIRTIDCLGASWHHCVYVGRDRVAPIGRQTTTVVSAEDFLIDAIIRSQAAAPDGDPKRLGWTYSDVAVIVDYDDGEHDRTLDELLAEVPIVPRGDFPANPRTSPNIPGHPGESRTYYIKATNSL